jgi:hypothetical protein
MMASCCQVVIFIKKSNFHERVSFVMFGTLELDYVLYVCGFVSFMTCERSR